VSAGNFGSVEKGRYL